MASKINPDSISVHELNWICNMNFRDCKFTYAVNPQNTNTWVWLHHMAMGRVIVDIKRKFT